MTGSVALLLKELRLPAFHRHYQSLWETAIEKNWSHTDYLAALCEYELQTATSAGPRSGYARQNLSPTRPSQRWIKARSAVPATPHWQGCNKTVTGHTMPTMCC